MDVHAQLAVITVVTALIQTAIGVGCVIYLARNSARSHHELARMSRAVAGLVVQESEKVQRLLEESQ